MSTAKFYDTDKTDRLLADQKRYTLYRPELTDGVYQLMDFAINVINLSSSESVVIKLPPYENEKARDFLVKLNVTADSVPQVEFVKSDKDDSVCFESSGDDWADLELGINYMSFTESER